MQSIQCHFPIRPVVRPRNADSISPGATRAYTTSLLHPLTLVLFVHALTQTLHRVLDQRRRLHASALVRPTGEKRKTHLGIQPQRPTKTLHRLPPPAQRPVHAPEHEVNIRLLGRQRAQRLELLAALLEPAQPQQAPRALEPRHGGRGRQAHGLVVRVEGSGVVAATVLDGADAAAEDGVAGVDAGGDAVVFFGEVEAGGALVDAAEAVPGLVVAAVDGEGAAVRGEGLVEVLGGEELVAEQRPGVGAGRGQGGGALEAFDGVGVLALQREGVAERAPRFGRRARQVHELVGEVGQFGGGLEVPQGGRVDVHVGGFAGSELSKAGKGRDGVGVQTEIVLGATQ